MKIRKPSSSNRNLKKLTRLIICLQGLRQMKGTKFELSTCFGESTLFFRSKMLNIKSSKEKMSTIGLNM